MLNSTLQVASTTWIRTLRKGFSGPGPMENDTLRQECRTVIFNDTKLNLCNYFKFMFVRHPFERLVSAWQDIFIDHTHVNRYALHTRTAKFDPRHPQTI